LAGAAKELPEAIIINPNNREEISDALKAALEMPREEQVRRNIAMQSRLRCYNISRWAMDFLHELLSYEEPPVKWLEADVWRTVWEDYHRSVRRLFIFDYDGTLVPFAGSPQLAKPSPESLAVLRSLTKDSRNELLLASGRDRVTLDRWFAGVPISLAAEHGAWFREQNGAWKVQQFAGSEWKRKLFPILEMYADRVAGAFVEEKEFSLVWHYRMAELNQGRSVARELADHLLIFTASIGLQVLTGNKTIEIRGAGINKGTAVQRWLAKTDFDFVLAIGDDLTDEDMFAVLPQSAYSFHVGATQTGARFRLRDPMEVLRCLGELAGCELDVARSVTT
jgi:trehalose 6-phosphate synthase/phosphatase